MVSHLRNRRCPLPLAFAFEVVVWLVVVVVGTTIYHTRLQFCTLLADQLALAVLLQRPLQNVAHDGFVDIPPYAVEVASHVANDHDLRVVVDLEDIGVVGSRVFLDAELAGAQLHAHRREGQFVERRRPVILFEDVALLARVDSGLLEVVLGGGGDGTFFGEPIGLANRIGREG